MMPLEGRVFHSAHYAFEYRTQTYFGVFSVVPPFREAELFTFSPPALPGDVYYVLMMHYSIVNKPDSNVLPLIFSELY